MAATTVHNYTKLIPMQHETYELTTLQTTAFTISGAKFSVSSAPILHTTRKVSFTRNGGKKEGVDLGNIMSDSIEYLKKMLGLTPDCLNGGLKTLRGECVCPKFYRGELCEELICVNNGTLVKIPKLVPVQYACRCPHPEYVHGTHCELVKCLNGGRPMDNGYCKCLDYWYTGQFCQEYTASWGAVLGLPLICMVIVIICCVICRLDLFPRKSTHSRRRRRAVQSGTSGEGTCRRHHGLEVRSENRRGSENYLRMQENLLNENSHGCASVLGPDRTVLPSYIIRLDTIPAFNPQLSSNVNSSKPLDPPPSYEQAIASSSLSQPLNDGFTLFLPPEYTAYPPPPPPRFHPFDVPRSV